MRTLRYVGLLAIGMHVGAGSVLGDEVRYRVRFDAAWSFATHPESFPTGPHFSGLIGGTHNAGVVFWEVGGIATQAIESMAEAGSKTGLINAVNAAIFAGTAHDLISGGGVSPSPGSVGTSFNLTSSRPLVTLVTMVAPSPDWFVGVDSLPLYDNGWVDQLVVELYPYDAGTDAGINFSSSNQDITPHVPIEDVRERFPFTGTPSLGTFTFTRRTEPCPADLNSDGEISLIDLSLLLSNFGTASGAMLVDGDFDLDGDVDLNDLVTLLSLFATVCP